MMKKAITGISLLLSALIIQMTPASDSYASESWGCDQQSLTSFWEEFVGGNKLTGRGTVCSTHRGLWSTMKVNGLSAGHAYTTWWVYIDDAASCANTPLPVPDAIPFPEPVDYAGACGLADFFTPDPSGEFLNPLVVYGRMDSGIAGPSGKVRFTGDIRDFKPSSGSQVWLFVFGHGPADQSDKRQLARQLLTPEDPLSGTPHLGIEGRPFGYPAGVLVIDFP